MNVADAAYATVHDYPGGSEALGPRVGIKPAVLRNKVNPRNPANLLTLAEADRIIGITDDIRIIQALAAEHDCGVTRMAADADAARESITECALDASAAGGQVSADIRDAMADGLISENEMRVIGAAALHEQQVMMGLVRKLRQATGQRLRVVEKGGNTNG